MTCEHLRALEEALTEAGFEETYRGSPWTANCREWVYFDCILDLASLRERFALPALVTDHVHRGTHDGSEAGFTCSVCHDAVMGFHPAEEGRRRFS